MQEQITPEKAASLVPDGALFMCGGFMGCGNPTAIIDALLDRGAHNLTMICNDSSFPDVGNGKLVAERRIRKLIASHVGLNPFSAKQMNEGFLEIELVPQGTLAERIRAAGAGLGGVLTPTGVGTPVEQGKQRLTLGGRDYLLETPLKADIALLKAWRADEAGNLIYRRSARNFNPLMAMAADLVIVEVDEILPTGALDPDQIHTPSIFVDFLVKA